MDKRPPTLPDLLPQDASLPLVQIPTFPQPWTQPATIDLLRSADDWPLKVAFAPYVGTAMVADTVGDRKVLARVSGSVTYLRADLTKCGNNSASQNWRNFVNLTGDADGIAVKLWFNDYIFKTAWPTSYSTVLAGRGTTNGAIIASPAANQDRQIEITAGKAAQTEAITVNHNHAITIWAGNRVGDLLTL
jgi:hypothetical protein